MTQGFSTRLAALVAALLFATVAGASAQAPYARPAPARAVQIWFTPKQSFVDRSTPGHAFIDFGAYDFPQILEPGAPWQNAAAQLSLLNINMHTIERYEDLPAVVAMTQRYHFMVATSGSVLFTGGQCERHGMEGLDRSDSYSREIVKAVAKWKQFGGRLDMLIMDSPFFFGYYASQNDCHFSIEEVARRAAATITEIRRIYPSVRLMDAEGPGPVLVDTWLQDFTTWLHDFQSAAGVRIDSVALDLHWNDAWHTGYDWVDAARRSIDVLHGQGVQAGLIVNAPDHGILSTDQWMDVNRAHLAAARQAGLKLDYVFISSWSKNRNFPARNLPETDPLAYTSLVDYAASLFAVQPR